MTLPTPELISYLDDYLRIRDIPDDPRALNGLQVEGTAETVSRLAVSVDACQATIDGAVRAGAQLLIVHHGLFWGGLEPVTGRHGRRLRALHAAGLALYAAHAPLDAHPEVGNNAVLARDLALEAIEPFGEYEGAAIGVAGRWSGDREALVAAIARQLGTPPRVISTGPARPRRVAVVTGAGSSLLGDAHRAGIDTFLTGEGPHHTYFDAEEQGMNLIYAGHYATETVGVRALARHLADQFGLAWEFLDHPTGL